MKKQQQSINLSAFFSRRRNQVPRIKSSNMVQNVEMDSPRFVSSALYDYVPVSTD